MRSYWVGSNSFLPNCFCIIKKGEYKMKIRKIVQGAYITEAAKMALNREAKRQDLFPGTLAAQLLEKAAKQIIRKESRYGEDQQESTAN